MAIAEILARAESLFASMSFYLNKIVIALVIVLAGFIVGKILESILRSLLTKMDTDERLAKIFSARRNYARAIRRTIVRIVYILALILALHQVSMVGPALTILEFLALTVLLVSFVIAGMDVVPNITARAALHHKHIAVGDEVSFSDETGVVQGTVVDMTLIDVRIKRKNGDIFFIPNAVFLKQSITKRKKL
jgi:small-conductance mechanosensitive channel